LRWCVSVCVCVCVCVCSCSIHLFLLCGQPSQGMQTPRCSPPLCVRRPSVRRPSVRRPSVRPPRPQPHKPPLSAPLRCAPLRCVPPLAHPVRVGGEVLYAHTLDVCQTATLLMPSHSPGCPWNAVSSSSSHMRCGDGSACDVNREGWACCGRRGGRAQCPGIKPLMCSARTCGGDHCCDYLADRCSRYSGMRPC
jgi:hypothetical protein